MPLHHGTSRKIFSQNVSEMMHAGHPQDQALAAAYRMKREGRADGGSTPWFVRNEARGLAHSGPIPSIVPGRTDRHNMRVSGGTYVLPADHVSGIGQGNTNAGFAILSHMFGMGPYGSKALGIKHGSGAPRVSAPRMQRPFGSDEGGSRGQGQGQPVDVVTAGGEFNVPPHVVEAIGYPIWQEKMRTGQPTKSPLDEGHGALDQWVMDFRHKKHVPTLKNLPNPAKR
jgi:hypothetical protein